MVPLHQRTRCLMYSGTLSARQSDGQRLVEEQGPITSGLEGVGNFQVLADRTLGKAAQLIQAGPPDDPAAANAEGVAVPVAGRFDHGHEEMLLLRPCLTAQQVVLDRVRIAEMLRRLHQGDLLVLQQETQGAIDEVLLQKKIGVDDQDVFSLGAWQSVVQIASLAVLIGGSREVTDAVTLAHLAQARDAGYRPASRSAAGNGGNRGRGRLGSSLRGSRRPRCRSE